MVTANRIGNRKKFNLFISLSIITTLFINLGYPQKGYAESSPSLSFYSVPNCFVEGVSLINGTYSTNVVDVTTEGVDPISVARYCSSEDPKGGWGYAFTDALTLSTTPRGEPLIQYPDGHGGTIPFTPDLIRHPASEKKDEVKNKYSKKKDKKQKKDKKDKNVKDTYSWSSTYRYAPEYDGNGYPAFPSYFSGQNHPDNIRIEHQGDVITAYHGNGTIRRFGHIETKMGLSIFELDKETLPSGNERFLWSLKYNGQFQCGQLKLETRSSKGKFLNHIVVDNLFFRVKNTASTNENVKIEYERYGLAPGKLNKLLGSHFFKNVIGPNNLPYKYEYYTSGMLSSKSLPNDRRLLINYLNEKGQVKELQQPTPNDFTHGQYVTSYTFSYPLRDDQKNEIEVTPFGRGIVRILSEKGKLLEYTRKIKSLYRPYIIPISNQKFFWGNKKKCEDLITIGLFSGYGYLEGARTFVYDDRHNMIEESLYGNLSGTCENKPLLDEQGNVFLNNSESVWIRHRYSDDGRNLLLETREESGKVTTYSYKDGTQFVTAELVGDGLKNIQRIFRTYNDDGVCVETILDDGFNKDPEDLTGVTVRRITRKKAKEEGIGIGCPLVEEELYLDANGELKNLSKRHYSYDQQGCLIRRETIGANGEKGPYSAYTYDIWGRLSILEESSGCVSYTYDENGNRATESRSEGSRCYNKYDRLNNLIERCESGQKEGRVWKYKYNVQGQCIEETDPFDQKTTHEFDGLGREIRTTRPSVLNAQGGVVESIETHTYDFCDRKIQTCNPAGHVQRIAYNMRGQITKQTFVDGSVETKEYTLGGALKRTVSRLGLVTEYDIDFMGRAVVKRDYDEQGQLLSTVKYVYKGLLLHSMIHEGGVAIVYRYDGAGRIVEQERNQELDISYTYDGFGRIHTKKEWIDSCSAKITTYTYDMLDNVVNEEVSDLKGNILSEQGYTYDKRGNRTETRQQIAGQIVIKKTGYDSWNRPLYTMDAEHQITRYSYEQEENALGQKVLKIIRCDPLGRKHITIYHVNGQIAEERDIDRDYSPPLRPFRMDVESDWLWRNRKIIAFSY